MEFLGQLLKDIVTYKASNAEEIQFGIGYEGSTAHGAQGVFEGRDYLRYGINLIVTYIE